MGMHANQTERKHNDFMKQKNLNRKSNECVRLSHVRYWKSLYEYSNVSRNENIVFIFGKAQLNFDG